VPFLLFLKSFEVLLYEVMSWMVFYPRTMWRAVRHPLQLMKRTEAELLLPPDQQFRDLVSPPIFLLLTVVAANGFHVAVAGNSPVIDSGIGLATMVTDNTSLILFQLMVFALLPVIAAVFALRMLNRPLDRDTLQPLFYAQCYATTPVVLLCSLAETLTRLPDPEANPPAAMMFAAAIVFYIAVEAAWFTREANRSVAASIARAVTALLLSMLALATGLLLFAEI
jgi:hypothetical protein